MDKYIELITEFVNHSIDVKEFECLFLRMFKSEQAEIPESQYLILDSLFSDVDMFCSDSELFEAGDLTKADLIDSAKQALKSLAETA